MLEIIDVDLGSRRQLTSTRESAIVNAGMASMSVRLAIQKDEVLHANGERQSYSDRWEELAQREGIKVVSIDVLSNNSIAEISECDAFMWRCEPSAFPRLYAKRLMMAIEQGLGIPIFPTWKTSWYFEDKIAQHYLLSLAGIPIPDAHVFWKKQHAVEFCRSASYPVVLKLAAGYQSTNVRLLSNREEALYYVNQLFGPGLTGLGYGPASKTRYGLRRLRAASELLRGRYPNSPNLETELQHGYFYVQEFLPDNQFDIRVTVIGHRAFVFRRFNRPDDFRASGSGILDWDPEPINEECVRLAFKVAGKLDAQTVAVDLLHKAGAPVVVELTLAYASWAVRDCPGHWTLSGEPETGELVWQSGVLNPEDAIFFDFVSQYIYADKPEIDHSAGRSLLT